MQRLSRPYRRGGAALFLLSGVTIAVIAQAAIAQLGSQQYVEATASGPKQATPGKTFTLTVHLNIQSDYHIQASDAKDPYIPTKITVTAPKGFKAGKPVFPASKTMTVGADKIAAYTGPIDVKIPVTPPKSASGIQKLSVKIHYQACNAQSCLPPTDTTAVASIHLASAPKKGVR